jgi:aminopeptidase 2
MDSEELREIMKPFVISLATPQFERLGWEKKPDEPYFDQLLRPTILAILAVSEDPHIVEHAKRLFKDMRTPDDIDAYDREVETPITVKRGADIDPDLRGVVYGTVVRHGGEAEFNKLLRMHNAITNSEERNTIAAALTGFRQPELVQKALSIITTDAVRLQDVMYWVAYSFMNRFARDATWQWLQGNWDWLAENFKGDLGFYRVPVYAARAFSNEKFLKEYKTFFEPKRSPAFDRSIDQGEEIIGWHSAWRQRDFEEIMRYFREQSE